MSTKLLPSRSEVPLELTWDLTAIYPNEAAFEADFAKAAGYAEKIAAYKGRMKRSGRLLLAALKLREEYQAIAGKLYNYAALNYDLDKTSSHYKALKDRFIALDSIVSQACSFIRPEILSIKPERLESFIEKTQGLAPYRHMLSELSLRRPHTRSHEIEELLASMSEITGDPDTIYNQMESADMKMPLVTDENGDQVELSEATFSRHLQSKNREIRKQAMLGVMGAFNASRNTIAATYAAQVKMNIFQARARKYESVIEMCLAGMNVPVSVYDNLVDTVHANFPLLQKYLELRKRILQVEQLEWHDLYVPIVDGVRSDISFADAKETVLAALAPLGEDYVAALRKGFASRWVDVVETKNKHTGAYSAGAYGVDPFILLNWAGNIDSMFTLAHEAGHTMHSYFAWQTQPITYSEYTLFVAEVASTTNEALLAQYLLKTTTDPKMRLYILNKQLEGIRLTLIRQTLFAEFEREAHARAEAGQPLTPDALCKIHKELNEKYYGPACAIPPEIEIEWARIPHFYSSFYVFVYATGVSAATALARQILSEGQPAVDRYRQFLRSGSSDTSINLLKKAGVDLSTPAPIEQAFAAFAENLRLFEEDLAKLG